MATTNTTAHLNELNLKLYNLYKAFSTNGDFTNAKKALDLIKKADDQEFAIGFCGHFSAGKSSMINELMNEELLPASPIPTSANLVKVQAGESKARIFYKDQDPVEIKNLKDFSTVKAFCKDGENVHSIQLSHPQTGLPQGVVVMDTPGIDSTDDEHRKSTEAALHLADIVFYVMDYNHVQSEVNFLFTKKLKEQGNRVFLVVNQIDKHDEEELSFDSFKNSVYESFASWDVLPDGIYFTSLKNKKHVHNQLFELKNKIQQSIAQREALLIEGLTHSIQHVTSEHLKFLNKEYHMNRQKNDEILRDMSEDDIQQKVQEAERLEKMLVQLNYEKDHLHDFLNKEMSNVLKDAYLMPFETRELAKLYLESRQPNFKIGFLFSNKKTKEEKDIRLNQFYKDLSEKASAQIDWHLKEMFIAFLNSRNITDENISQGVYDLSVDFPINLIEQTVNEGALVTGDSVLNFTNDIANEVKRYYREAFSTYFTSIEHLLYKEIETNEEKGKEKLAQLQQVKEASHSLISLKQNYTTVKKMIDKIIKSEHKDEHELHELATLLRKENERAFVQLTESELNEGVHRKTSKMDVHSSSFEKNNSTKSESQKVTDSKKIATELNKASKLLKPLPSFQNIIDLMVKKADRLKNKSFSVALFGAFSAGKSSFANALMGEKVLPVSPNPTTAAINRILPIDANNPHGTAIVKLKSREQLLLDINDSLRHFSSSIESLAEADQAIEALGNVSVTEGKEKTHLTFLLAAQQGLSNLNNHFGEQLKVDLKSYQSYVADETKACFVEWIDLYYDCPLTKRGITLVDTPGADSINARHTDVAFEYIKNADAILFVTYYNHAFSNADREFLIQLGRVKETFELDKMFFIVNAADLAQSQEECESVVEYIREQLLGYGIRNPRLHPLSSKQAIQEKLTGQELSSHIDGFEKSFYSFIDYDLMQMSIQSATADLYRAHSLLSEMIASANEDEETKQIKRNKAKSEQSELLNIIGNYETITIDRSLNQEISELVYYIKQRVFLRLSDFFNESFNPSSLREDGRSIKKALDLCLDEFLQVLGYDLAQEMRATSLRLEAFFRKKVQAMYEQLTDKAGEINENLQFTVSEVGNARTPEFDTALINIDHHYFKPATSVYKNGKQFFEQNGKKEMKEKLEELLQSPIEQYLDESRDMLTIHYEPIFKKGIQNVKDDLQRQTIQYFNTLLAGLEDTIDIEKLEEIKMQLENTLPPSR